MQWSVRWESGQYSERTIPQFATDDGAKFLAEALEAFIAPKKPTKAERARAARRARTEALRSMGLVRVRGALGGVYWE